MQATASYEMGDVSSIEALAARDEKLGGDEFFGAKNFAGNAKDLVGEGTINPVQFDGEGGVADSGDEIDEVFAAACLRQPHGILNVGLETFIAKNVEGTGYGIGRHDQVKVFGGSPNAGVVMKGEAATHCERNLGLQQPPQSVPIALACFGYPKWLLRRSYRQLRGVIRHKSGTQSSDTIRCRYWLRENGGFHAFARPV
jgi:hypothetical protein